MKRTCAIVLASTLIFPNCAARGPALATQSYVPRASAGSQDLSSRDLWKAFAEKLPIGSTLKVRTSVEGPFTATLLAVGDEAISVKPKTRIAEGPRQVRFDEITNLELATNGGSLAKAAAVGAGIGAGTFVGLMLLLFAAVDD